MAPSMANMLDWREQSRPFASMTFYRRTSVCGHLHGDSTRRSARRKAWSAPSSSSYRRARAHRPDLLAAGVRARRSGRRVERGPLAGTIRGVRAALGQTLTIDGEEHLVIGVMPRTFQLPSQRHATVEAAVRFALVARDHVRSRQRSIRGHRPAGAGSRIRRGSSGDGGDRRTVAGGACGQQERRYPDRSTVRSRDRQPTRRGMWLGFAAVLCLLAIACANAGGLLSARAARRRANWRFVGARRRPRPAGAAAPGEGISLWAVASAPGVSARLRA